MAAVVVPGKAVVLPLEQICGGSQLRQCCEVAGAGTAHQWARNFSQVLTVDWSVLKQVLNEQTRQRDRSMVERGFNAQ